MTRMQVLRELRAAMSDPARTGDIPALKSELVSTRASPEIEAKLADVRGYHPPLDLRALAALPPESFGYAYTRFLAANNLSPIALTGRLDPALIARNAFVVRYGIIHDMVHVLTGFDASWSGEVGVWAFVGAQGYSRTFQLAAWAALLIAPLRCPLRLPEAWRAFQKGRALAKDAPLLLTLRLEEYLPRELDAVRAALSLTDLGPGYLPR